MQPRWGRGTAIELGDSEYKFGLLRSDRGLMCSLKILGAVNLSKSIDTNIEEISRHWLPHQNFDGNIWWQQTWLLLHAPSTIIVYDIYLISLVVNATYSTNDNYYIDGISIKNSIERGCRAQENSRYALYNVRGANTTWQQNVQSTTYSALFCHK